MRQYTVTSLTAELDRLVNRAFPRLAVEGEISQISTPTSGHAYLTLRDGDAVLPCVVWRGDWSRITRPPRTGDRVICHGRLGLYSGQGRYQLYANRIEAAGEGQLQRELAEIRRRLDEDGLLDPRRKRPLPTAPGVVGIATSTTGAALQDFLRVSRGRWPAARILVAGCKVQGVDAAASIVRALDLLYEDGRSDVIVVTRGGGSRLDLLAFHDEGLARWIATGPVPIVSAVGHEIDTTIADLVADAVAPTPSAAAMLVLPDAGARAQWVDEAQLALEAVMARMLRMHRRRVVELAQRLRHPGRELAQNRAATDALLARLRAGIQRRIEVEREHLDAIASRLQALSPQGVLERGYAIVEGPDGIVRDPGPLTPGDLLDIQVSAGRLRARVVE
ncbi:MAG TPA: exodeoxyribonuclease VII large subunit [Deltaproteobacteria bacterium]|nr:exodeoxyribonuclease VII large subunit [Deltaproteobacteria bacterium]